MSENNNNDVRLNEERQLKHLQDLIKINGLLKSEVAIRTARSSGKNKVTTYVIDPAVDGIAFVVKTRGSMVMPVKQKFGYAVVQSVIFDEFRLFDKFGILQGREVIDEEALEKCIVPNTKSLRPVSSQTLAMVANAKYKLEPQLDHFGNLVALNPVRLDVQEHMNTVQVFRNARKRVEEMSQQQSEKEESEKHWKIIVHNEKKEHI